MSLQLTQNQILELVAEANRAPSVHNVQPAKWAWTTDADGASIVTLYSDQTRRLHVGDPHRLDEGTSLGAAWEGLHIALNRHQLSLQLLDWMDPGLSPAHPFHPHLKPVAIGKVTRATKSIEFDEISQLVFKRKSYRGKFDPARPEQLSALATYLDPAKSRLLVDRSEMTKVAKLFSQASDRLSTHIGTQKELLQWLRFSPSEPGYFEDGLNAEALALPRPVARLAKSALQLSTHPMIFKMGLTRILTDETPHVKSSSALLILYTPVEASPLSRGQHLYRSWLQITRAGLSACPMSVLADDPQTHQALKEFHPQGASLSVLNVFRIGLSPEPLLPLTPRLPPERLITL